MINDTFYPTPTAVIDRMLAPLVRTFDEDTRWGSITKNYLPGRRLLEPSAGKGDILDHLVEHYNVTKHSAKTIEIDPELQATLTGKGYTVIDSDFLTFAEPYRFDLIIMNPPFDAGAKHLLKAWEVLDSGHIVCLLNAETVCNPYSAERKALLELIEKHGRYEEIGAAFAEAERATNVEVVIVWLHKEEVKTVDFSDMQFEREATPDSEEYAASPLAHKSSIKTLVQQYQAAVMALEEVYRLKSKLKFFTRDIHFSIEKDGHSDLIEQVDKLKEAFWRKVFEITELATVTTSNFQRDFERDVLAIANLAFSERNIYQVLSKYFEQRDHIIQQCIVAAFDRATSYHEKNIIHSEGWKTNKSYRCNKKVIFPNGIRNEWSWGLDTWQRDFYNDMDKALCFVRGINFESIRDRSTVAAITAHCDLIRQRKVDYDQEIDSEHFKIRLYKKGTTHITFKDLNLLTEFNLAAAKGKNWIGAGY